MRNPVTSTKKASRVIDLFEQSPSCVKVEFLIKNQFQPGNLSKSNQNADCCKHFDEQQLPHLLHLYIFPN